MCCCSDVNVVVILTSTVISAVRVVCGLSSTCMSIRLTVLSRGSRGD